MLENKKEGKEMLSFSLIEAGGLEFLKTVPDKSVSIITSGLEIIRDAAYAAGLKREILRVLSPQGAWIIGPANFEVEESEIKDVKHQVYDLG